MRKDPPFDMEFLYTTYLLEDAQRRGSLIVNRCESLRNCNEKLFATHFPQCCPTLTVSRDMAVLRRFHREHGDVIFKPLDGMGGSSIFRVRENDANLGVILETLTQQGRQTIMAQTYLPEIAAGDKRILMINEEPLDHCWRSASLEKHAAILPLGKGRVQPLTERDR